MNPKTVAALLWKDVRLHGVSVLLAHIGVAVLVFAARRLTETSEGAEHGLVLNLNGLGAMVWSEWFVSRERSTGTFGWLRTLPIASRDLWLSKLLVVGACTVSLWLMTSLLFLRSHFVPDALATWAVIQCTLLAFGAVAMVCRWRFPPKVGQLAPLLLCAVVLAALLLARSVVSVGAVPLVWNASGGKLAVAFMALGIYGAVVFAHTRWIATTETRWMVD